MTEQTDIARGRALVERWCVLAEQRLDYLTDLFETGRWRRFFDEFTFLENIKEAKQAVSTWKALLEREATSDNRPIDLSWLGRRPQQPAPRLFSDRQPAPAPLAAGHDLQKSPEPIVLAAPCEPEAEQPDSIDWTRALDPEILQQRYPMLRSVL